MCVDKGKTFWKWIHIFHMMSSVLYLNDMTTIIWDFVCYGCSWVLTTKRHPVIHYYKLPESYRSLKILLFTFFLHHFLKIFSSWCTILFCLIAGYTILFVSCCVVHVVCVLDVFPCYTYYGKLLSPIITTNQITLTTILEV